jgi:hypothetical protein
MAASRTKGDAATESVNPGDEFAMLSQQLCDVDTCEAVRIVTFADENLCCDHFVSRCYEFLEQINASRETRIEANTKAEEPKKAVAAYSQKVLEVCLGGIELSNLQRARLLDILLWVGEISNKSHPRERIFGDRLCVPERQENNFTAITNEKDRTSGANLRAPILH